MASPDKQGIQPPPAMDRFGITFRNPHLERDYMSWMVERVLHKGDLEVLCVLFVLMFMAFLRFLPSPESWFYHVPVAAISVGYLAWDIIARSHMSAQELAPQRTGMVLRMRFAILFLCWVVDLKQPDFTISNLLAACVANSALFNLLLGFCLRLKLQHHLLYQTPMTFALMFFSTKRRCISLMETPGAAFVTSMAHALDYSAKRIMGTLYSRFGLLHGGQQLACPCLHLMAWVHVYVTLILGSFILWKLEQCSRQAFINTLPEERRKGEGLAISSWNSVFTITMHAVLFVVAFGVIWEFNFVLVRAIAAWGS